jgi:hypothetical protein
MAEDLDGREVRRELGEILDQLNALPPDAFRERSALADRQHELRRALAEIELSGSDQIKERWTERAASKPAEDEGKPVIPSPTESGGSG